MAHNGGSKAESLGEDIWKWHDYRAPGLQGKKKLVERSITKAAISGSYSTTELR